MDYIYIYYNNTLVLSSIVLSVTVRVQCTNTKYIKYLNYNWLNVNYPQDNFVSLINEPRVRTRQGGRFDLQPTVRRKNISNEAIYSVHGTSIYTRTHTHIDMYIIYIEEYKYKRLCTCACVLKKTV